MIDMVQAVLDFKSKGIKRYPCKSNRASSLGYFVTQIGGCLRRGVYERSHWQEKELHSPEVQLIFDEGHYQEEQVLKDLAAAGVTVIEQQTMYEWPEYQITGHIDGKIIYEAVAYPLEIKSMNPNIFAQVNSFEDFKKKPWTRAYMAQIMLYMLMQGVDKAIFLLKDKSNGLLKQIIVDLDYELGEYCIKAAETINKHVAGKTLPDRIDDREVCKKCPYKILCLPDIDLGVPLKLVDDPLYEKRLNRYYEIKENADEAKKLWEIIRTEAKSQAGEKGGLNIVVGGYRITGKKDVRGAFRPKVELIE